MSAINQLREYEQAILFASSAGDEHRPKFAKAIGPVYLRGPISIAHDAIWSWRSDILDV